MKAVLDPKGQAKPSWKIFSEFLMRTVTAAPSFNPGDVMDEIAGAFPAFAAATYDKLDGEGVVL